MKRGITILVCVLVAGVAAAQSPDIIRNTKATMDGVSNNATKASNEALGITAPAAASASQSTAKPSAAAASNAAAPAKAAAKVSARRTGAKPAHPSAAPSGSATAKTAAPAAMKHAAAKSAPKAVKVVPVAAPAASNMAKPVAGAAPAEAPKSSENTWPMTGKRDPFVSPVVYQTGASNCTGGKKCLEIGAINFRGVVRSENGFIAVVTNGLNKAYFLRENDPVFDGYVVKITGDSIVFQETLQDRLGKTFTREVVKKLTTPSV